MGSRKKARVKVRKKKAGAVSKGGVGGDSQGGRLGSPKTPRKRPQRGAICNPCGIIILGNQRGERGGGVVGVEHFMGNRGGNCLGHKPFKNGIATQSLWKNPKGGTWETFTPSHQGVG